VEWEARIRTYGSACNQSAMVLQAIQDTKVNSTSLPSPPYSFDTNGVRG
jgi:hypothetical protein